MKTGLLSLDCYVYVTIWVPGLSWARKRAGAWGRAWALLAVFLMAAVSARADSFTVTITADNGYGFGFGDQNGIYAGQYYGGVDNCTPQEIFGNPCYTFVPPEGTVTDTGAEIYNITASTNDYIYIAAWFDDSIAQGTVASFTDNNTGVTVTTSPAWPWQVYATGTNWYPGCGSFNPPGGPPLTGSPEAINTQIAVANANAGTPGVTSVGWVNTTGTVNGSLYFSGYANGYSSFGYPFASPPCIASPAVWMQYDPEPLNPNCNPFLWGSVPDYNNYNFLRKYLIYRIGPLGPLTSSNTCASSCPQITVPPNIVAYSCSNCATVTYAPTVTALCGCALQSITCNPLSGSCFPPGLSTVTVTATDVCTNTSTCSFTVNVICTNCFTVQCPDVKYVQCRSAWTFDPPIVSTCCTNELVAPDGTLTNLLITFIGAETNFNTYDGCTAQIVGTWEIMDGCGDVTNCYDYVVIPDCCSSCFQFDFPTNKIVPCGQAWSFDSVVASSCCPTNVPGTATNLVIVSDGIVTNGACPLVDITQTWTIEDGCGDVTNCSQTVTVEGCCPPSCCTNCNPPYPDSLTLTMALGSNYLADPFCQGTNDILADVVTNVPVGTYVYLWDWQTQSEIVDQYVGVSASPPTGWSAGGTETLLPGDGFILLNISGSNFNLTLSGCEPQGCPPPCQPPLGVSLVGDFGTNGAMSWSDLYSCPPGCGTEITIVNPSNQVATTYTFGVDGWAPPLPVPLLQAGQSAWVYAPYSTPISVTCPPNKTVQCGSGWTFDTPQVETCCTNLIESLPGISTNLLVTPFYTLTNGVCPSVTITQVWSIVDGCGNTASCSQVVTVEGCCAANCCTNCNPPYPDSLTLTMTEGSNYVTDPFCQGSNNTLAMVVTNVPVGTYVFLWNSQTQKEIEEQYVGVGKGHPTGWSAGGAETLSPGEGFILLDISGSSFNLTLSGCEPQGCPPPCQPALGLSLVGGAGTNAVMAWSNLFSCPPICGMEITIVNPASQQATTYTYSMSGWTPALPVPLLQAGQSAWVDAPSLSALKLVSCPQDKSVQCGAPWTFDPPLVETCCTNLLLSSNYVYTNLLIIPISITTNGACPSLTITQVWAIMDGCGDTTNCSQVVTVEGCCTNNSCCGPYLGQQTVNWLQLPPNGTSFPSDPTGDNAAGTWVLANLPCYGRVLVTQTAPTNVEVSIFHNADFDNVPNASVNFNFPELGYGPYVWGALPGAFSLGYVWQYYVSGTPQPLPPYQVTFYFLDGPPNPCNLVLGDIGLAQFTYHTLSQPFTFRTEYDGPTSSYTLFNNVDETPLESGVTGTVVGSAYPAGGGDNFNTGWAVLQPAAPLQTTALGSGSGPGWPGPLTNVPYVTVTVDYHQLGDGMGFDVGYICCTNTSCWQVECPTNFVVECGATWSFTNPTATTCCPSGVVHIVSLGAVTNGPCPKYATNTWAVYDDCGHSNTCMQVVEMIDTTPPSITCPTNAVIVALTTNCTLEIPTISVTASDNCTPPCSLIYTQSPTNGTIISGTNAIVTVTVTDLCGNSNSCVVDVQGQALTPPTVTVPRTIAVSNCLVPCVPVTASCVCCPGFEPIIAQSPLCGTQIGPGVDYITVTVTDCHGNVTVKNVRVDNTASPQSFLTNLFNTGVADGGLRRVLGFNTVDPHYGLPPANVPSGMPADYHGNAVVVADQCQTSPPGNCNYTITFTDCPNSQGYYYKYVPWNLAPDPAINPFVSSAWIGPDYVDNVCLPTNYNYTYTLSFQFPNDLSPTTAWISGRWTSDNDATMMLNGHGVSYSPGPASWTHFTIPPGAVVAGQNTFNFVVDNTSHWSGLRVEFTNAVAGCAACVPPYINSITPAQTLQAGSTAFFSVKPGGGPITGFQWADNGVNIPGATNASLKLGNISFANGGLYSVIIDSPCGTVTGYVRLSVFSILPWPNASWNFVDPSQPLQSTFGSNLVLSGSSPATNYAMTTGSTLDFDLPDPAGQPVNVMDLHPGDGGLLQLPEVAPAGTNAVDAYTLIMDLYEPDTSQGMAAMLFASDYITNLSSGGQDGLTLTMDESNYIHLTTYSSGAANDSVSTQPLAVDTWTRVALVEGGPLPDGTSGLTSIFLNGASVLAYNCMCCPPLQAQKITWPTGTIAPYTNGPSLLTAPTNSGSTGGSAEFYVAGIQFHAFPMTPQMIAGLGATATGPMPATQTPAGPAPTLTATLSQGTVNITWKGSPYALQETSDLSSEAWTDSVLPFTQTLTKGNLVTTAMVQPAQQGPAKFYRLIFRP